MLVLGLGKTGLSCVRFLHQQGYAVSVMDSRESPPELAALQADFPNVPVHLGAFDITTLLEADCLVVSPGIALQQPVLAKAIIQGKTVIGDIEIFARYAEAPIIAITGSNGKSTVTDLVGEMAREAGLKVAVGGNIGTPVLDLLAEEEVALYVLELSSFQLETTYSLDAAAAVVLNISPDHMDRYEGLGQYARAKQRILYGNGTMVLNADDPIVMGMCEPSRQTLLFSMHESQIGFGLRDIEGELWLCYEDETLIKASELRLVGRHNYANALAALALGVAVDIPMPVMLDTLRRYGGLAHRCQWVAEIDGVNWYNDSKGTNVGATLAAIEGLDTPLVLIAGGEGKGADFSPLHEPLAEKARAVILIGQDADEIEAAIDLGARVQRAVDMQEAVVMAARLAEKGDSVLLSPACASFDMFSGYAERGEVFMQAVRELQR